MISHLVFTPTGWVRYPLSLLNIEFVFGVLAAWIVRESGVRVASAWWVIAGVVLAFAMLALMTTENMPFLRLIFSFGLALAVIGFALRERASSLAWPPLLLLIGNASYSVYLIHNPLLSVTQRVAGRLEFDWLAALMAGIAISLLAGLAYYQLIERPALSFCRNRLKRA